MPISDQVKSLTEDIEACYETRRAAVFEIAKETRQALGKFNKEREQMADDLKLSLVSKKSERASQVRRMRAANRKDLAANQKILKASLSRETGERIELVRDLLSRLAKEHEAMSASLRSELSSFQKSLNKTVGAMMADFSADHGQSRAHWQRMTKAMAAKRAGKHASTPEMDSPEPVKEKKERKQK